MKLSIKTPCTEPWDSMQAHPLGKFCLQCNKPVVDFTGMTDTEIITTLRSKTAENKTSGVCGRFKKHQLQRPLYMLTPPKQTSTFRKMLAGLLLLVGADYEATAQTGEPELRLETTDIMNEPAKQKTQVGSLLTQLKGRVLDADTKEPIPFCMIYIKGSALSTASNADGYFVLDIPTTYESDSMVVQFNYIGYDLLIKRYKTTHLPKSNTIYLLQEKEHVLMGDVMYIEEPAPKKEKRKRN